MALLSFFDNFENSTLRENDSLDQFNLTDNQKAEARWRKGLGVECLRCKGFFTISMKYGAQPGNPKFKPHCSNCRKKHRERGNDRWWVLELCQIEELIEMDEIYEEIDKIQRDSLRTVPIQVLETLT